jgi:hypothetical protein
MTIVELFKCYSMEIKLIMYMYMPLSSMCD